LAAVGTLYNGLGPLDTRNPLYSEKLRVAMEAVDRQYLFIDKNKESLDLMDEK
jgi:hypothetical protein